MQIYAYNHFHQLTAAAKTDRQVDYRCPECLNVVHVRQGQERHPHFFHLKKTSCRQSGKSVTHLKIQHAICEQISGHLEYPFRIKRIADVYWPAQKLVFEVQCSPISTQEIARRNLDYAKMGCLVVWILHDKIYNRSTLTNTEFFLRTWPHYYTNINAQGEGIIYDQLSLFSGLKRTILSPPLPISIHQPNQSISLKQYPRHIRYYLESRQKISFSGDLLDHLFTFTKFIPQQKSSPSFWSHVKQFYITLLQKYSN